MGNNEKFGVDDRIQAPGAGFATLIAALPVIVYVLDSSGTFIFLNEAVRDIGYEPDDLLGRHFSELIHEEDRTAVSREAVLARIRQAETPPVVAPKLFDERRSGGRMTKELKVRLIHGKTGQSIYASVNAYGEPVEDPAFKSMFKAFGPVTMGVIHDTTTAMLYQKSLEENLAIKELLLKEVHQRVRDNLQIVASLAHLREMEGGSDESTLNLEALIAQIKSVALVHEVLYETESSVGVSSKEYFERFSNLIAESYGYLGNFLPIETDVQDRILGAERTSYLGIVASQWISELYRRAGSTGKQARIKLSYSFSNDVEELTVCGGSALTGPELQEVQSLGMEIAHALAQRLGGAVMPTEGPGFCLCLRLPLDSQPA
ncbi:MAG: histidine kinase dimerization/phosphoacceptor domain -containing protein [Spirochaetia bacterium]|jgi:PAS domain S-box-containing protein|nr:histidine kinase dimerization/phosphoacceptor domain -containing protein [Spirochaetia bacterium]